MDLIIRPATAGDTKALAAVLARAFATDPLYTWVFPDERGRQERLAMMFAAQLRATRLGRDQVDVAVAGGQSVGCALWSPPGAVRPLARQQLAILAMFPVVLRRRLATALSGFGTLSRARPAQAHWYLSTIAVDPSAQRMGVARGLLAPRLARCDQMSAPAALVTCKETNLAYYQGFGFAVTGDIALARGGPAHWSMWRPPHQSPAPG